jgi:hypothetical protein
VALEVQRDLTASTWQTLLEQCPNLVDLRIHSRKGFRMSASGWVANGHATRPWERLVFEHVGYGIITLVDEATTMVAIGFFLQPALRVLKWNGAVVTTDVAFWNIFPILSHLHALQMNEMKVQVEDHDAVARTWLRIMPQLHHLDIRDRLYMNESTVTEALRAHWPVMLRDGIFPPTAFEFGGPHDNVSSALDPTHFATIKTISDTIHGGWHFPWDIFFERSVQHATWTSVALNFAGRKLADDMMSNILSNPKLAWLCLLGPTSPLSRATVDKLVNHPRLTDIRFDGSADDNGLVAMSADAFHTLFHDKRRWFFHYHGVIQHITAAEWRRILRDAPLQNFVFQIPNDMGTREFATDCNVYIRKGRSDLYSLVHGCDYNG